MQEDYADAAREGAEMGRSQRQDSLDCPALQYYGHKILAMNLLTKIQANFLAKVLVTDAPERR
jgi:hypothetical protein